MILRTPIILHWRLCPREPNINKLSGRGSRGGVFTAVPYQTLALVVSASILVLGDPDRSELMVTLDPNMVVSGDRPRPAQAASRAIVFGSIGAIQRRPPGKWWAVRRWAGLWFQHSCRPPRNPQLLGIQRSELRSGQKGGHQTACGGERQPQPRHRSIPGDMDQIGADCRSKAAKDRGGKAIGNRETRGPYTDRHDFREENDHGAVVAAVDERQPEFDGE